MSEFGLLYLYINEPEYFDKYLRNSLTTNLQHNKNQYLLNFFVNFPITLFH